MTGSVDGADGQWMDYPLVISDHSIPFAGPATVQVDFLARLRDQFEELKSIMPMSVVYAQHPPSGLKRANPENRVRHLALFAGPDLSNPRDRYAYLSAVRCLAWKTSALGACFAAESFILETSSEELDQGLDLSNIATHPKASEQVVVLYRPLRGAPIAYTARISLDRTLGPWEQLTANMSVLGSFTELLHPMPALWRVPEFLR